MLLVTRTSYLCLTRIATTNYDYKVIKHLPVNSSWLLSIFDTLHLQSYFWFLIEYININNRHYFIFNMHVINVNCQLHVHTFRKFSFIRLVSLFFLQSFEIMIIKISVSFLYSISFSRLPVVMCYTGFFSSVNLKWDKNKETSAYLYNIHCAS